jgi:hypothetical protein
MTPKAPVLKVVEEVIMAAVTESSEEEQLMEPKKEP